MGGGGGGGVWFFVSFRNLFSDNTRVRIFFFFCRGRRAAGGRPHRFPHDNFSSVYWIFTKLGHMISL